MATKAGNQAGDQKGKKAQADAEDDDLLGTDDDDLDDDAPDADDDEDDSDDKKEPKFDEAALLAKVESRIDSRLNVVLREIRKQNGQQDGSKKTAQKQALKDQEDAPTADVRGARLAFRDYLGDEGLKFLGAEERRFATDLGQALIKARALDGFDDEDEVGREVAKEVSEKIKSLRTYYERSTKTALRRQGLLPDQKGGQQAAGTAGAGGVHSDSQFTAGATLAGSRHPRPASQ